jgi:RNA polymerase sigma factor (TIGR02999 family)
MLCRMEGQEHGPENAGLVTQLLRRWSQGDTQAADQLMPLIYGDLRRLAAYHLKIEGGPASLPGTALVHEAYLRLAGDEGRNWKDRVHFFAVASRIMRHLLVDRGRRQKAAKRDVRLNVSLDEALTIPVEPDLDLVALDLALDALSAVDARKSRVVELRYFGGLSVEETAEALGVSCATVHRDWEIAKLWLYRNLNNQAVR